MIKLALAVPVMNQQDLTQQFLDQIRQTETDNDVPVVIIDNGSEPPVREWLLGLREGDLVIRNGENRGVMPALNQAFTMLKDSCNFIFYTHNDVMIYESGWDAKIKRILETEPNVGVAGFYGAKGLGTPDIYRSPYLMQQLIRTENVSNCNRMDAVHGYRNIRGGGEVEEVAVMDGFSLIVNVELLKKTDGFDRSYPPHHNYDNDICLESLDKGFRNIVISMDAQHLGGRTDVGEDWAKPFGKTKQEIHTEAHPVLYEKWRPGKHSVHLPIRVN